MSLRGRKLGLLVSCGPKEPNFERGLRLAKAALEEGIQVYLYFIDEAVIGLTDPRIKALENQSLNLFACAYGAQSRNLLREDKATWAGLGTLTDIIVGTDRFVTLN